MKEPFLPLMLSLAYMYLLLWHAALIEPVWEQDVHITSTTLSNFIKYQMYYLKPASGVTESCGDETFKCVRRISLMTFQDPVFLTLIELESCLIFFLSL